MTNPWGTPRGRCDEYSSKVFLSIKKPRYVDLGEERQTTEGDANWLNNIPTRASFNDTC
jgi:hypothetical protein